MDIDVEICKNLKFFPKSKNRIFFLNSLIFIYALDFIVLCQATFGRTGWTLQETEDLSTTEYCSSADNSTPSFMIVPGKPWMGQLIPSTNIPVCEQFYA